MKNSLRVEAETNTVIDYPHTVSCAKDLTNAHNNNHRKDHIWLSDVFTLHMPQLSVTSLQSGVMIETRKLTKRFDGLTAVDHVSFNVKRGRIFGLLSPNGAGKITTTRMLATLTRCARNATGHGPQKIHANKK